MTSVSLQSAGLAWPTGPGLASASRQWPEAYDSCHTFLHVARVKTHTDIRESHVFRNSRMSVWFFTRAMCKNVPLRQNLIPRATAYLPERHVRVADVHGDIDYEIMIASQSESLCAWFVGPALALRRIVSLSRDGRAVHGDVASLCRLARCTLLRLDPNCCLSCKQRTVSAPGDS